MICLVFSPTDVKNILEVYNLRHNNKGGGKAIPGAGRVCALDWANFADTMVKGEKLYLLAHSDGMTVSSRDGENTAAELAERLLKAKLRPDVGAIKLVACRTGNSWADSEPFCQVLSREIYKQSGRRINVPVTGIVGDEVMGKDGKIRGVLQTADSTGYDEIMEKYEDKLAVWEQDVRLLPIDSERAIIEAAEAMKKKTETFFEELYAFNRTVVADKDASRFKSPLNR
jgi:hypothetical protein